MLRIVRSSQDGGEVTLRIEGRIVSDWIALLEGEIHSCLEGGKRVVLDFSEVRYLGRNGARMLRNLSKTKVRITNCPALIEEILKVGESW